jgi:hypothetical protein
MLRDTRYGANSFSVTFRIPQCARERLEVEAAKRGITVSAAARLILLEILIDEDPAGRERMAA